MPLPGTYPASEVMDLAASLLNDTAKSRYTYAVQLPYLKLAAEELKLEFQLNNLPITNVSSQIIPVNIGDIQINPPDGAPPTYPGDLVEIQGLFERTQNSTDPWIPVAQLEFLPHTLDDLPQAMITYWTWQNQRIFFCPAGYSSAREVKLDFINDPFVILDENTVIQVINGKVPLSYRTAGLCAQYIMQNSDKATELNTAGAASAEDVFGISIKGKQSISTRKRPFRSSYRGRGLW